MQRLIYSSFKNRLLVRVLIIIFTLSICIYTSMLNYAYHATRKNLSVLSHVEELEITGGNLTSVPIMKDITEPIPTVRYNTYGTPKLVLQTSKAPQHRPASISNVSNPLYRKIWMHFRLSQFEHLDQWLNLHQYKYLINADICKQNLFVLAFVHSSPKNVKERNQIRSTWGGYKVFNGKHFRTVFMLGDPQNDSIQLAVTEEAHTYKDIVQGDFKDTYRNLTYKHIMGFTWTTNYCPNVSYILKTDDDTMVNFYNMLEYLTNKNPKKNFLYCSVFSNSRPLRRTSKWRVNFTEYPFIKYPSYCEGFAYVMTPDVAVQLLRVSKEAKFYWIDDVFVTGILNIVAQVPFTRLVVAHGYNTMSSLHSRTKVQNVMFILVRQKAGRRFWYSAWQAILKYGLRSGRFSQ